MSKIFDFWAKFVGHNSMLVLIAGVILTGLMIVGAGMTETQTMDYQDMLPENYDVIEAFQLIESDFGSTMSGAIVIELDAEYARSNERWSVVEPDVVRYSRVLENYLSYLDGVEEANGLGDLVWETYGEIPNSIYDIRDVARGLSGKNFVGGKEDMMLVKLTLSEDVDSEGLTNEVLELIDSIDRPAGLKVSVSGEIFEDVVVDAEMGPDTSRTSMISMIAIVVILGLLFRSIKGVLVPLMTIIFGIIWTMGFLGWTGGGLSSMTSGAISMIMGIGIDFGIQVMSRFNRELENSSKEVAMEKTLSGILGPIFTTALACLIGFRAMGLGELSFMAELGTIMSYGVLFCMAAAISIVPALLVVTSRKK